MDATLAYGLVIPVDPDLRQQGGHFGEVVLVDVVVEPQQVLLAL
jgi:hypothetical protein